MAKPISRPSQPKIPVPYLTFKFNAVQMIGNLGDGKVYHVPIRMVDRPNLSIAKDTATLERLKSGVFHHLSDKITVPDFDLDHVHRIELKNELPVVPKQGTLSEGAYAKICDGAYTRAAEAKNHNDEIRRRLYHYEDQGIITVLEDPFESAPEVEGLTELAETIKASQESSETSPESNEIKSRVTKSK